MTAQALQLQADIFLTILSGPEAGVAYKLVGKKLTIGRAKENDIVLQDSKASRRHVVLEFKPDGKYFVTDLGSQNGIYINGNPTREASLSPGDTLLIGTTQIRFGFEEAVGSPALQLQSTPFQPPTATRQGAPPVEPFATQLPPPGVRAAPPRSKALWVAAAGLIIAVSIALSFKEKQARKPFIIKDEAALQEQLDKTEKENEALVQEITVKGKNTAEYEQAQGFFLRGFRDFREGNYSRAIQNFEAARSLYPQHQLAPRYLERSRQKLDETISQALQRGEKAFQLQKYGMALNEYRTVMFLNGDPKNKNYQFARKRSDEIKLIQKSNY